jgi:hypothetical protein
MRAWGLSTINIGECESQHAWEKGNSYGKREQFLHVVFGTTRECRVLELEGTIVGMCGSCLEL